MSLVRAFTDALRHALGLRRRRTFAEVLDEALQTPFVTFSARALEQAYAADEGAAVDSIHNPQKSANAGDLS